MAIESNLWDFFFPFFIQLHGTSVLSVIVTGKLFQAAMLEFSVFLKF